MIVDPSVLVQREVPAVQVEQQMVQITTMVGTQGLVLHAQQLVVKQIAT